MTTQRHSCTAIAAALVAFSSAAAVTTGSQSGPGLVAPIELDAFNDVLAGPARTAHLSTQILSITETADGTRGLELQVRLGDNVRTLDLKAFSMRAPGCKFFVQDETGLRQIDPPPVTTYRGRVLEDPRALAHGSWHDGQLHATIFDGNGDVWAVEPVSSIMAGLPAEWHVVYNSDAVLGSPGSCGVTPEAMVVGGGDHEHDGNRGHGRDAENGDALLGGPGLGQTEIGFDADFEFYQANGSSVAATIAYIEWVMNNVGTIYQTQMVGNDPICYTLTGFIVRTVAADPYSSTDEDVLLCQFMDWWNDNVPDDDSGIPRDTAHLFTGKDIDGNVIGYAFNGTVCDHTVTNCNGGKAHYGFSQILERTTDRIAVTAHELGHNWSACHCNQTSCTGGSGDPDCGIMNSTISGSLMFNSRSRQAIDSYRDDEADCLAGCLQTVFVHADSPIPGCNDPLNGSSICPFASVVTGYDAFHWVGGELRIAPGAYPDPIMFDSVYRSPMTIRRWETGDAGHVIIGGN